MAADAAVAAGIRLLATLVDACLGGAAEVQFPCDRTEHLELDEVRRRIKS